MMNYPKVFFSRRFLLLFSLVITAYIVIAQPTTDVYLFDLDYQEGTYQLSAPTNVSNNPGYDNQPSFSANGRFLYYTSWQEDEQTDIIQYELKTGEKKKLTNSDGSEYSPTEMPNGKYLSTILLERDGTQLLWQVPIKKGEHSVLVRDLKIGYHCWYSKTELFSFVLGEPNTLQFHDLEAGTNTVVDSSIGRSLHKIPGQDAISYVSKKADQWVIVRLSGDQQTTTTIAPTLEGSEDLTWTTQGDLLMGSGDKLYVWSKSKKDWTLVADLSQHNLSNITRLAANPSSTRLAIVVND